jgi:hypothetical protein
LRNGEDALEPSFTWHDLTLPKGTPGAGALPEIEGIRLHGSRLAHREQFDALELVINAEAQTINSLGARSMESAA